jgi:hypothetical protein
MEQKRKDEEEEDRRMIQEMRARRDRAMEEYERRKALKKEAESD